MRLALFVLALAACAARPVTGILVLHLAPADARVLLDDRYIGSARQLSGHRLRVHAGPRRVEVTADGHYAQRREADVGPNAPAELRIELHEVPDGLRGD
jgi:hypothetical protein